MSTPSTPSKKKQYGSADWRVRVETTRVDAVVRAGA
jgi:hypothetical protein